MNINFSGHHLALTPALKDFTTEKLERLSRHFERILSIDITFEVDKLRQIAKANIHIPGNHHIHADSEEDDMYKAVDLLVDKLDRQLKKQKDQMTEH